MKGVAGNPSLIPYLQPSDARFLLRFSANNWNGPDAKGIHVPFCVISQSYPLNLILEASIVSDAGAKVENVFLLMQKDDYQLTKDELWPFNNLDVDRAWQNLFSVLTNSNQEDHLIVLKDQVDSTRGLLHWRPLFYCKHVGTFFHPACPKCGFSLDVCYDDDLLKDLSLQPYSRSLKRYLFCARCFNDSGESNFYLKSLDLADSANVKDKMQLIRGFGELVRSRKRDVHIPCLRCPHFEECYESDRLSFSRIASISFYPFFMLLFKAQSIHILEFLPLLGGANGEDLRSGLKAEGESGRLRCLENFEQKNPPQNSRFLFEQADKHFLEILYLKLSLLGEVCKIGFSGLGKFKYPNLGLSIDQIWVSVAEQSGMLPLFWNFRLKPMGIGGDYAQPYSISKLPPLYGLYLLGAIWFYALLANRRQGVADVNKRVGEVIQALPSETDVDFGSVSAEERGSVFSPENIYWDPNQKAVRTVWVNYWTRSLDLGLWLLRKSISEVSQWSETEFWEKFYKLRAEIRDALFMPEARVETGHPEDANNLIGEILKRILDKWRSGTQPILAEPGAGIADLQGGAVIVDEVDADLSEDKVVKETVLLSPEDFKRETRPPERTEGDKPKVSEGISERAEPPEGPEEAEEDLPKTVILAHNAPETKSPSQTKSFESEKEIPKTVIVSPKDASGPRVDSDKTKFEGPNQIEQAASPATDDHRIKKPAAPQEDESEDLPKTIILSGDKDKDER